MKSEHEYAIHSDSEPERLERQAKLIDIENYLPHIPYSPGEHIIDAACGSGSMTRLLARSIAGGQLTGVDIRADYLDYARRIAARGGLNNATFTEGSILDLPFAADSFDGCWASLILHWLSVDEKNTAMKEMARVVRPGGWIVCTEPDGLATNFLSIEPDLLAEWSAVMHGMLDPDMGRKLYPLMHEAGLENITIAVRPFWFHAIGSVDRDVLEVEIELQRAAMPSVSRILGGQEKAERHYERIREELKRPDSVLYPLSFIVCGRKPN